MRKILLPLAAIVLFTMNISAQKQFTGIIKIKTDIVGENLDASVKAEYPVTSEMKVLNNKYRRDINSGGLGITFIGDGDNNKNYLILDITAMAMGIYYREIPSNEKIKYDFKHDKGDTKTILGFACYKVTCTTTNLETDETSEIIIYISDDFLPDFQSMNYPGLKGFPLYTTTKGENDGAEYTAIEEVIEIKADKKVKPANFLLPAAAVSFDQMPDEVKAMLGMDGDDD